MNGNGLEQGRFFCNGDLHHASTGIEGTLLVEDEVADAVVDGTALVVLDGLKGMRMVADEGVGTSVYQRTGLKALLGDGLEGMLPTPVQGDEDDAMGVCSLQPLHLGEEGVVALLADAGFVGQVGEILQRQAQGGQQPHLAW